MEQCYTSEEVCQMLKISKKSLDLACMQGRIGYSKPGRRRIFTESDIEAYLASSRREVAA